MTHDKDTASLVASLLVIIHRQNDLIAASEIAARTVMKMNHIVNLLVDGHEAQSQINKSLMASIDALTATQEEHGAAHDVFRTVINEHSNAIGKLRRGMEKKK